MTSTVDISTLNPAQLAEAIRLLKEKSDLINSQAPISEAINRKVSPKWEHIETTRTLDLKGKLTKMKAVVYLEFALIESIRGHISEELLEEVRAMLVKVRKSDDLRSSLSVFHKAKDDVKVRQLLKLINTVYRYNRTLIYGEKKNYDFYLAKSRIKHATLCPHCGQTAKQVLEIMAATKSVKLPVDLNQTAEDQDD
jgi:predicted Zn-ribbon and HTH transcriptional regulator